MLSVVGEGYVFYFVEGSGHGRLVGLVVLEDRVLGIADGVGDDEVFCWVLGYGVEGVHVVFFCDGGRVLVDML